MHLARVEEEISPIGPARRRLTGEILFRGSPTPEQIWFDVPDRLADALSTSGNPWLACLLPLAVTLQEPLTLSLPVDPGLREGVEGLMQVWRGWFPGVMEPIAVEAELLPQGIPDPNAHNAAFFSGGLDSFYTLLRHEPNGDAINRIAIHDLITVWGFDIPLANRDAFERLISRNEQIANSLGKSVVPIATNLRESSWSRANWGLMGQGPALAAVALALESRFQRVLLPASIPYRSRRPWGTHPLVDPLLSTTRLSIANDGAVARRVVKGEAVATSELAMGQLRVCWMGGNDTNCGRCEKCLRTLTMFEILGLRDRCISFPADAWSLAALGSLRLRQEIDRGQMERVRFLALEHGRRDIVHALDHCIRRYAIRRNAVRLGRALHLLRRPPS